MKKYEKKAVNEKAVEVFVKIYGLVSFESDKQYVVCSDPAKCEWVREKSLKKKLKLSGSDLDYAIKETREAMKTDQTKTRLTSY